MLRKCQERTNKVDRLRNEVWRIITCSIQRKWTQLGLKVYWNDGVIDEPTETEAVKTGELVKRKILHGESLKK